MSSQNLTNTVQNKQLSDMAASMDFVHNSLVIQKTKSRLPEDVFKYYFLDYFSGNLGSPTLQNRNVIAEWIGVAGSPMGEVDVFDPQGNVLFTVPALFDTNMLAVTQSSHGKSIGDILYEYNLRKSGIPAVANNYLIKALDAKAYSMNSEQINSLPSVERWFLILSRYGVMPKGADNKVNNGNTERPEDDLEY